MKCDKCGVRIHERQHMGVLFYLCLTVMLIAATVAGVGIWQAVYGPVPEVPAVVE